MLTRYYRLDENVAQSLFTLIPELVEPASWRPAEPTSDSPRILLAASGYDLIDADGGVLHTVRPKGKDGLVVPQSVLIIRQRRSAHQSIGELIDRIKHGDALELIPEGLSGGLGGGGGFGGSLLGTGR